MPNPVLESGRFESSTPSRAWNGIVAQAILVTVAITTVAVLGVLLGAIRPSARLRAGVAAALGGPMLLYLLAFLCGIFGVEFSFLYDSSGVGLAFSLLLVVLAGLSIVADIDSIVATAESGAPASFEWYCAWGLTVSITWLYLEVLRLLARVASRQN